MPDKLPGPRLPAHKLSDASPAEGGRIILAATPIGDPADASPRLREVLSTADVVAAEDTRRLHRLAAALDITVVGQVVAHHDHNEAASAAGLVERALKGACVVLVSDAGMPSVSDPGFRLVSAALAAGVPVTAVPGPSAVLAALAVSGLPSDRFSFEGFLPRKAGERDRALAELAGYPRTMVFFEAPHRLATVLAAMVDAFGADRPAAVCRELTKTYEEIVRDDLAGLARWAEGEVRGEITIVVGGAVRAVATTETLVAEVVVLQAQGRSLREATKEVAKRAGRPARELYDAVLASRNRPTS